VAAYFDTSVICKWYVPEHDTPAALRLRRRFRPPFVLTHLHELELITAWQLKVFRGELSSETATLVLADLRSDVDEGFWVAPAYDLAAVYRTARQLGALHVARIGARSLDILHVAAARELGAQDFVTGDARQARLATEAGLRARRL
jgi:predicted nucleic acid-binding protein